MKITYEQSKPKAEWIGSGDILVVTDGSDRKCYMIVKDEIIGKPGLLDLVYYGVEWFNHEIHIRNHMNKYFNGDWVLIKADNVHMTVEGVA